jgi:6-pyruvoyltetrahydropterin/6-carboxytetrahydropterin synthase
MFTIGKSFTFEAAHHLDGLPEGHKCARQHGHSYRVEVLLESETLTGPGFVADFAALMPVKAFLDGQWDHRCLNDVLAADQPTCENLARHLFEWCRANLDEYAARLVAAVRVSETRATWAEYRPAPGAAPSSPGRDA